MKRMMLVLILLAAVIPFSFAASSTTTCITQNGCFSALPETVCKSYDGFLEWFDVGKDVTGTYTANGIIGDYATACTVLCCDANNAKQNLQEVACRYGYPKTMNGGAVDPVNTGVCLGETPSTGICANGQTDCICDAINIKTGENRWCCNDRIVDTQECASSGVNQSISECGNGEYDPPVEQCDGANTGICPELTPAGQTPTCTVNCRCAQNKNTYDPTDPYCSPGEECAKEVSCTTSSPKPVVTVSSVARTDLANVTWSVNILETCEDILDSFRVDWRITGTAAAESKIISDKAMRFASFTVESKKAYDVRVCAIYGTGEACSDWKTGFVAGDKECFAGKVSWCDGEKQRYYCVYPSNQKKSETCGQACLPAISNEGKEAASCGEKVDCGACNGAYASFGETLGQTTEIELQVTKDVKRTFSCQELTEGITQLITNPEGEPVQAQVTYCYIDFTYSALKEYRNCYEVSDCTGYQSADTCSQNSCQTKEECTWYPEVGLCNAQNIDDQTCNGDWEENECGEMLGCYWDGNECIDKDLLFCEDFENASACTGGTNFAINSNTNKEIATAQNDAGITKCVWQGSCYKDADGNAIKDPAYDKDITNPVTTLIIPPASLEWGSLIEIPYTASADTQQTYASLRNGACGSITRPTETNAVDKNKGIVRFSNLKTGTYCLEYFSKDWSNNMEYVKQQQISVNENMLSILPFAWDFVPWLDKNTTDIKVWVNVSRQAQCTLILKGKTVVPGSLVDKASSNKFYIAFSDVKNGVYDFNVSCSLDNGATAQRGEQLVLDFDTRITRPIPAKSTYTNAQLALLGIHSSSSDATCSYLRSTWTSFTAKRSVKLYDPITKTEKTFTEHTSIAPTLASGVYELPVRCAYTDGTTLTGGSEDAITFAIDELAPKTTVSFGGKNYTQSVAVGKGQNTITLSCVDKSMPALDKQWESGCKTIRVDSGDGYQNLTLAADNTFGLSVVAGDMLKISAVDNLGNAETPVTLRVVDNDISGPERPDFEVLA